MGFCVLEIHKHIMINFVTFTAKLLPATSLPAKNSFVSEGIGRHLKCLADCVVGLWLVKK